MKGSLGISYRLGMKSLLGRRSGTTVPAAHRSEAGRRQNNQLNVTPHMGTFTHVTTSGNFN